MFEVFVFCPPFVSRDEMDNAEEDYQLHSPHELQRKIEDS